MAGLGFKDFTVGEVLTSADVDGYLMQQTVMRFADSGARGSALGTAPGTAVALAEGMVSYLSDTNKVQVYLGSEWVEIGPAAIGANVVQATTGTTTTTTSSSFQNTALAATITPTLATSKVLILVSPNSLRTSDANDSSRIAVFRGDSSGTQVGGTGVLLNEVGDVFAPSALIRVDSPATTSAQTYTVCISSSNASNTATLAGGEIVLIEVTA